MNENHSKIVIVIGTKAELIKCMPIMLELQSQKKDYWFIHTGQHSLKDFCEKFKIKRPDFVLSPAPKKSSKFMSKITLGTFFWNIKTMLTIRNIIHRIKPKYVLYHGDTMNTAMAVGASSWVLNPLKKWKTVHLEAGLRSGSLSEPFPEEFIRRVADRFSDLLLAVSTLSENNLRKEKVRGRILNVGNTVLDSAPIAYKMAGKRYQREKKKYALINIHRHENLKDKERLKQIVSIIKGIKITALWPIHDNTMHFLKEYGLLKEIKEKNNIRITPLVDYVHFIFLLANSEYLLTDGGSIQEESLIFKKPCIILRKKTERPEGLSTGINFLTNLDVEKTKRIINNIEHNIYKTKKFENPYGKEGLSKKIVEILK